MDKCCMSIPVIFNPQIVIYTNKSSCGIPFYTGMKKNGLCSDENFLPGFVTQRSAWDFAGYSSCGESISTKRYHVTRCLRHATAFLRSVVFSCLIVEEVTDVYRWSTALVLVNFSSPSKRCAFLAISVTRIHVVLRNYSFLYPWDFASWSLNC